MRHLSGLMSVGRSVGQSMRALTLGALLAGVLSLGALTVTGSAAGAANRAFEVLDADNQRPLAGATRYETAALIAQEFVDEAFESESYIVVDAIVVSGEGFADALSAAALAGRHRAPILLTPPNALASVVKSFVSTNQISTIYLIGGTAAVSQSVADSLDALAGVSVTRLSGNDRYLTALSVAEEVGGSSGAGLGSYCNTRDQTVLLANGEGFADALAGGPLAFSGPHPILLTPPSGLPGAVLSYLDAARVDRVIILGGTAVISTAIETAITDLGIETTRLAGDDRFATAVAVTKALTVGPDDCGWIADDFGFANGRSPYDALAGSALLGQRQSPILLTEPDQLATATNGYLARTPQTRNGNATTVRFSVLGGVNTVTPAVVALAIGAATNAAPAGTPIAAEIVGYPNEFRFIVNFAEEMDAASAERRSAYALDGAALDAKYSLIYYPADPDADNPKAHVLIDLCCDRLTAGSIITVQANTIEAEDFSQGDNRYAAGTRYTVPTSRPRP